MIHLITFSAIARIRQCPASAALPRTELVDEALRAGTARHDHIYRVGTGATEQDSIAAAPEQFRALLSRMVLDGQPIGPPHMHEVAYALDPTHMQARVLGQGIERNYATQPGEIPGTMDVVTIADDAVHIVDWKGSHDPNLAPPGESLQMRTGLLAAMLVHDRTRGTVGHVRWGDDGIGRSVGPMELTLADLIPDAVALESDQSRVAQAQAQVSRGIAPDVYPGHWCRWCPSVLACPDAVRQWTTLAAPPDGALQRGLVDLAALLESNPSRFYAEVRHVETLIKQAKEIMRPHVLEHGDIHVSPGRVWGLTTENGKEIDGAIAFRVVHAAMIAGGADEKTALAVAGVAVSMETSEAALKRAAEAAGAKPMAAWVRARLSEIDAAGGLTKVMRETWKEHDEKIK